MGIELVMKLSLLVAVISTSHQTRNDFTLVPWSISSLETEQDSRADRKDRKTKKRDW